jgi:proteic killer suppression protein
VEDLFRMPPLRFHPLKGDREGQFALTLIDRFRLIVSFPDQDRKTVQVEEVSAHYGD